MKDNIRKEAFKGIELIKNAGIQVCMVTGDSKETDYAIAKDLKIIESENDITLTSDELNMMNDEEIKNKAQQLNLNEEKYIIYCKMFV